MFNTYIEDKAMIPVLLGYDWMIMKDTWTDCPYETYMYLKKKVIHNGNAKPLAQHMGIKGSVCFVDSGQVLMMYTTVPTYAFV